MAITATQLANTTAAAFDIQFRYFGGESYADLTLSEYAQNGTPTGWDIPGDGTITPDGDWDEITTRVYFDGSLSKTWRGSSVDWTVKLSGDTYSATYLAEEMAIACCYRITRSGYDSGWSLFWLGMVSDIKRRDDYRGGDLWTATISSSKHLLGRYESPRVVAGAINVADGASVTASSTLTTPGVEVPNGEFVGTAEDASADNIVDGRMSTVWVSQYAPRVTEESLPTGSPTGAIVIDEVFMKPVTGWNVSTTWWVELLALEETDLAQGEYALYSYNTNGEVVGIWWKGSGEGSYVLSRGERAVICGNKARFEAYTGGADTAAWIVEANTFRRSIEGTLGAATDELMDLSVTDGYLWLRAGNVAYDDVVKWCDTPGSSAVTLPDDAHPADEWPGNEFDSSALTDGQSFRRTTTGTDTNAAADWAAEDYPKPGAVYDADADEWVLIELAKDHGTLSVAATAGDTSITVTSTVGWPDSGEGIIESDDFTYTGRTSTTLTGIPAAGAGALDSNHVADTTVYPYYDSDTQTGWRLSRLKIKRRDGLSAISKGRVYVSHLESSSLRNASEASFEADWEEPFYINNKQGLAIWGCWLNNRDAYPWIKSIMIVIDEMSDQGRAKINDLLIEADQASLDASGLADITATSYALAAYIVGESSWMAAADVTDSVTYTLADSTTDVWGAIGTVQTAITSISRVLDDIAAQTGCLCVYNMAGGITWQRDPWWRGGMPNTEPDTTWIPAYMRGEVKFAKRSATVGGVVVEAMLADGTPLQSFTYPPNATGVTLMNRDGYTVSAANQLWDLAFAIHRREVVPYEADWVAKGIGEWCAPGQWHNMDWDTDDDGLWIVDSVSWSWSNRGGEKSWKCDIGAKRYG